MKHVNFIFVVAIVLEVFLAEWWDYASLWGWDFAVMAMTAVRLGKSEYALDILEVGNCQVFQKMEHGQ